MILEVAFRLFATYSYPDVSYSLLEEATGISRGSMVYYFKNKEGIFRAVLETFLFSIGNVADMPQETRSSLSLFCEAFIARIEKDSENFRAFNLPNLSEARLNIERSAAQFIPEFKQRELEHQQQALATWEEVIANAVKSGELKPDTDPKATAKLFEALHMGYIYMGVFTPADRQLTSLRELFSRLYEMIKI